MDAVILAGGRGSRMFDLVPEYHKPLLQVDGIPLVCRAVDLAHAAGVSIPVVVVAPQNAEAIENALGDRQAALIVQRRPRGPGHALALGLSVHTRPKPSDRVLLLLADNVSTKDDVAAVAAYQTAVGIRCIPRTEAHRFTRYENGMWLEKIMLNDTDNDDVPDVTCWIGPVVGDRERMTEAVHRARLDSLAEGSETLIGPYLGAFMRPEQHNFVEVSSRDVGTIESFLGGQ